MTRRRLTAALTAPLAAAVLIAAPAAADPLVPTQVTASVSTSTVDQGQTITVTGQVTKETPTGWVGVPGGDVLIRLCVDAACSPGWGGGSTQSATGGHYSLTFAPARTGHLQVIFTADSWQKPWLAGLAASSTTTPQVNVLQFSTNSTIEVGRQANGQVKFFGVVGFPNHVMPPTPPVLRVEFSADNATWTTVNTVTGTPFHGGNYTYTAYTAEPAPGWWRAVYDGLPTAAKASTTSSTHIT
ncbi:hypothetical protein [Saccharothrix sp. HUAS TT1]|uniref:hypothetical protein n=1 Tax=unclassified Saccharothrix TaxID=2593673 RepID=UPI00345BB852